MKITTDRRDGVRVIINNELEGIIFSGDGFPDFGNNFVMNMGGIRLRNGIEYHQSKKVNICLFHRDGSHLSIDGEVISSTPEKSIIKFNLLSEQQRQLLQKMLALQPACLSDDNC